jgi:hypothetical protein
VVAITSVLIVVLISLIVTRAATVILIVTGLSRESARFQARSALSGVGFTTSEAEAMLSHPIRRRVVMFLMLFGSAGILTVVASLIISFTTATDGGDAFSRSLVLAGGLLVVLLISRSKWVDRHLSRLIAASLTKYTDIDARDYAGLLNLSNGFAVIELHIKADDWLAGRVLGEIRLHDEGVAVLGLTRGMSDSYVGVPIDGTPILPGDAIVIYGHKPRLSELDSRKAGVAGDRAHDHAVEEHLGSLHLESMKDARDVMASDEMRGAVQGSEPGH